MDSWTAPTAESQRWELIVSLLKWSASIAEASERAKESQRPILIQFEAPG